MSDFIVSLQSALYDRLVMTPAVANAVGGRIYDDVPSDVAFPYIELGEISSDYAGAKDTHAERLTVTVHVWSRYEGKKEAAEIMKELRLAITSAPLVMSSGNLVLILFNFSELFRDPDGQTRHGVVRFRAVMD